MDTFLAGRYWEKLYHECSTNPHALVTMIISRIKRQHGAEEVITATKVKQEMSKWYDVFR